jgi:hypothetical protein
MGILYTHNKNIGVFKMTNEKIKKWVELETYINDLFWHIKVTNESKQPLCKGIVESKLNAIKSNYDFIDNF